MSNEEVFFFCMAFVIVIVALIGIPIGVSVYRKTKDEIGKNIYGEGVNIPSETKHAKLISKSYKPNPYSQQIKINSLLFEFDDGSRAEFSIKDSATFDLMVEGDHGSLTYQGKKFIEFKRDY